jgi:hypothetical protein
MNKLLKFGATALELAWAYPVSLYAGLKNAGLFDHVLTYCLFLGCPRSGHSLVGSLLDAHPNMVVADELDALRYVYAGFSRRQIYSLLLEQSRAFAQAGCIKDKYSYQVPNQWQGRFQTISVIGDKKGEGSTLKLRQWPGLLGRLRETIDIPIKFIHVVRNPYDNIARMFLRRREPSRNLPERIDYYFSLCETVAGLKQHISRDDFFEIRHESFVSRPQEHLLELCHFLGVEASPEYLHDCASIVFPSPRRSRIDAPWTDELIEAVRERIERFAFLEGYTYHE